MKQPVCRRKGKTETLRHYKTSPNSLFLANSEHSLEKLPLLHIWNHGGLTDHGRGRGAPAQKIVPGSSKVRNTIAGFVSIEILYMG